MTVDEGFGERKVSFTRYELLKVLRWTTEGRSYSRLQSSLDRLSGVRIKATNAFYDNDSKSHSTRNFGVIDAYEINDGRDNPKPSFFIWSEEIFKSFQAGFIKKLDLDFYLGLKSAVSKRLYRYLDKHFWYKTRIRMNLFVLAHEKVGISRNYQYASSIRQQLDPAVEELISKGLVAKCEYAGKGRDAEITLYAAKGTPRAISHTHEHSLANEGSSSETAAVKADENLRGASDFLGVLCAKLAARGLKEAQAQRLLAGRSAEMLSKIEAIIAHYDNLLASKSNLISRSPVGFLYRAVENAETFILPGSSAAKTVRTKNNVLLEEEQGRESLQAAYLQERRSEVAKIRDAVEPVLLERIGREVEGSLGKLRKLISAQHFKEAVQHGVEEKLAALFALPGFEEWKLRRRPKFDA